ncbi:MULTISPECIES: alpha/beta fold hydrolase [unclassified Pseudomonas]|uniref:alpha/beta fold hydrolase n=1 Tax=unclassified Pseudomonas TaxID=196821 RepID=UPI0018E8CBEA|nr:MULTISPECIES: alpha/beta hydrolase [unclassified Pseudomonas]MBJ2303722.1 alpha/beta hydrolase [Pseudomonas sp. MF2846]MBK3490285.1 alpha/beta hydrolase [Pseudomonas sp. MF2857]
MQPAPVWFTGGAGNRLAADVSGPENGPPILLLHGGGQTRHSWSRAHRTLAGAGYRVISLDARGHGQSDWIESGDYGPQAQVDDLLAVIGTLGAAPALVGASMGGVNSLLACASDPRLAACLILVDVAPRLEIEGIEHIFQFMTGNADGFTSLAQAAQVVSAYNPHRKQTSDTSGLEKNLRLRDDGRWYWHWDPRFMAGDHRQKVAGIAQRMQDAAGKIEIPTLLVRGQQSDVVSPQGAEELQAMIPHMKFVDVEGAGHMVAGDKNDLFNAAIIEFLQRHYPAH